MCNCGQTVGHDLTCPEFPQWLDRAKTAGMDFPSIAAISNTTVNTVRRVRRAQIVANCTSYRVLH